MYKLIYISLLAITVMAGPALAQTDDPTAADYEPPTVEIEARNSAGYLMSYFALPYFTVDYSILDDATEARVGWSWVSSGEPLLFVYDGPLSDERFDPLNPGSCPEGVDPAAMAALVTGECILRQPGVAYASLWPMYPIGRFYRAELPDGGAAFIRTAADAPTLENLVARLEGEQFSFVETDALSVLREMNSGKPAFDRSADWSLEEQLANADMHSFLAYHGREDREAALQRAEACLRRMLELYRERHGRYPETIADLATIPGAICAALPHSPYDFEQVLEIAIPQTAER